jgi:pantoate--beta-alanine ligase
MKIISSVSELQAEIFNQKKLGKRIGFVPTMGFLHEGHTTLMKSSVSETDCTVVSIFVNPAQFNDLSDFEKYPRDLDKDTSICKDSNVDILFVPTVEDFYPEGYSGRVLLQVPNLMQNMCATTRPGHFEGVLLVISRLFHFVSPTIAYFGKKDFQQYLIIKEFCRLLAFPVEVKGIDTIREKDGLAMSSRNARLSPKEREAATLLYRAMKIGEDYSRKKRSTILEVREVIRDVLLSSPLTKIDYLEILNPSDLTPKEELSGDILIALAVFVGQVRLIDNWVYRISN